MQSVPNEHLGEQSDLFNDAVRVDKVEYADPELSVGYEPFYHRVGDCLSDHL
ncbi:hypothetical protein [Pectobacterium carotovorum]|uniref:hypothetical protein n=1 Tax=Pectobacterium carotovorum TaxID=554 RepID=UPI0018F77E13|nr:hypothetical protein [Pectobacterium carotovorum]